MKNANISAVSHQGLSIVDSAGRPARLAIVDQDGTIIDDGPEIARTVWEVSLQSYRNYLRGQGYLRVHAAPPGADIQQPKAAA
ncbi:hypothetical protein [Chitinimonas koreensis]|nr:hypothetical protein [Chitinimonas koreensis]